MAPVYVDAVTGYSARTNGPHRLAWSNGRRPLTAVLWPLIAVLYSLSARNGLLRWLCCADGATDIVLSIAVTITVTVTC